VKGYPEAAISALQEAALFSLIDAGISAGLYLLYSVDFLASFGLILIVEGAGMMLVGGGMGITGQAGMRKVASLVRGFFRVHGGEEVDLASNDIRAAFYMMTGVFLFVESAILASLFA
jgi:hypothetical protein